MRKTQIILIQKMMINYKILKNLNFQLPPKEINLKQVNLEVKIIKQKH